MQVQKPLFVFQSAQWSDCLLNVLANPDLNIVLRGVVIVKNMINAGKEVAEKVIETQAMDCLQAHIFKAKRRFFVRVFDVGPFDDE